MLLCMTLGQFVAVFMCLFFLGLVTGFWIEKRFS